MSAINLIVYVNVKIVVTWFRIFRLIVQKKQEKLVCEIGTKDADSKGPRSKFDCNSYLLI